MGVDINQYRAAIGSFFRNGPHKHKILRKCETLNETRSNCLVKVIKFVLLTFLFCALAVAEPNNYKTLNGRSESHSICVTGKQSLLSATVNVGGIEIRGQSLNYCRTFKKKECNGVSFYSFSNLDNHYSKSKNGNRKQSGIKICHFNKGNSYLCNRMYELENIVNQHRPLVLGISESNFFSEHDRDLVQIPNYKFITAKTLENPELNVSRVCVYLHNSMVGKVRHDLMDDTFSSIWLEVGLPNKRKILICNAYREWGYMRQAEPSKSRDLSEQINRWEIFLRQWERALDEEKEVIVTGDLNVNHLEWTKDNLPPNSQTRKLRPLITELFARIISLGVSQLVTSATRVWPNQPDSGLDHLFSNYPGKLSPVQVINNGGSDHKLLLATRYSNSIKRNVRYVTKRCYKNFNKSEFISAVQKINFWNIYKCDNVDQALKILNDSLTQILDIMAPIKTIQIRENYAPWLSSEIKQKMADRDEAQKIAAQTKLDKDWKLYKQLRNNVNSILKNEKRKWQRRKFQKCEDENDTRQIWKNVKSWLNWTTSGAPTQLFHNGTLLTRPSCLAECMNVFFVRKVINLKESLLPTESDPLANLRQLMSNRKSVFKLQPVHPDTVDKMITNLKNSGSVGLDYIDTSIIKM